jgi:hypothetical protein
VLAAGALLAFVAYDMRHAAIAQLGLDLTTIVYRVL